LPLSITADNATSGALTVNGNLSTTGTLDVNGGEIILDADADTSITADTDDQIDFKIGNVDVATLTNSNLVLKGTTPTLTIGDAGAEDTKIVFDGNAQDFYIGLDDSADDLVIGTGSTVGTNGLVVIENGGNVGINTLTPTFRLDVNGSLSSNGNENVMRIAGSDTNNAGGITINNVFGASASARVSTLFSIDGQDQASPLAFGNGTSEAIRIASDGKVGIGTTSPNRNLTVFASNPVLNVKNSNADLHLEMAGENAYVGNSSSSGFLQLFTNNGSSTVVIDASGNVNISGALSKGSGSFKIDHPLESKKDTHYLYHSFVEAPQADNIYRGIANLENGTASINLDTVSNMTEGTFVALNREVQCYTTNETDWDAVKGNVEGNILTISCQNTSSSAIVSWLVIGERQDKNIYSSTITDENGKLIVEKLKSEEE